MATQIQLQSTNYNGQLADITFYPCSGGTISLGNQTIPYTYTNDNYEGTYDLYFSAFNQTCQLVITCPTPTPTPSVSPTITPTITPTNTLTPTPTKTPVVNRTLGRIISTGGSLSGTTFGINYNSVVYPISTLFNPTNLSATIPVQYPQPGRLYNFVLVPDSGFTISSVGSSFGAFNRIRITTGASTGLNQWACVVDYMLNASVLFTDSGDTISVSSSSGFGQTWNINLTIGSGGPTFQVTAKELAAETGDNLTTENSDIIEIQS